MTMTEFTDVTLPARRLRMNRVRQMWSALRLSSTARAVRRDGLTYLTPAKLLCLEQEVKSVLAKRCAGDIVEFGVALGGSSVLLAANATKVHPYHGFDLFGLIPPPDSEKDDDVSRERYREIVSGTAKGIGGSTYYGYKDKLYEEVCETFARYGTPVDGKIRTLHRGLFSETLGEYRGRLVAFAHLDCDWYDPVRLCLTSIGDRLVKGGVIVVDDYDAYGGCRTAVDEFLQARPRQYIARERASLVLEKA